MATGAGGSEHGLWLGLLKWSLSHQDGTAPSEVRPLDDADRAWLTQVMQEGVRDDVKFMTQCVEELQQLLDRDLVGQAIDTEEEKESILLKLEELRDVIEQVDMANIFSKMGGGARLLELAAVKPLPHPIRCSCLVGVSAMSQNNIHTQDEFISLGAVERLREIVLDPSEGDGREAGTVRAAALGALSAIVRGHALGEMVLAGEEELPLYLKALNSESATFRRKAIVLLKALVMGALEGGDSRERLQTLLSPLLSLVSERFAAEEDLDTREKSIELFTLSAQLDPRFVRGCSTSINQTMEARRVVLAQAPEEDRENIDAELQLWIGWEDALAAIANGATQPSSGRPSPPASRSPSDKQETLLLT